MGVSIHGNGLTVPDGGAPLCIRTWYGKDPESCCRVFDFGFMVHYFTYGVNMSKAHKFIEVKLCIIDKNTLLPDCYQTGS